MSADARSRLTDLLNAWEEAQREGRDLSAAELCRECPDLHTPLEEQIAALRRMQALLVSRETSTAEYTGGGKKTPVSEPVPETVAGYRVVRLLGRGGMGQVFEVEDPRLGRHVAVKRMLPELAGNEVARGRFVREAQAMAALTHDHVVGIFQVGDDAGTPFFTMPLLEGESLDARLQREKRLPVAEVVRIGREAAEGLAAAHAKGLVHRDVKPGNLWLEAPSGRIKILDFGLARVDRVKECLTQTGAVLGTPAYMAPEQIDAGVVDGRTDVFALGCVLYRAATGKLAFDADSLTALLRAIAERDPTPPDVINPEVPLPLSDLILRMLAKVPAIRPESAAAVAAELAQMATGTQTRTGTQFPPVPRGRGAWRRILAAVVVAIVVIGVSAWLLTHRGAAPKEVPQGASVVETPKVRYRGEVRVRIEREVEPEKWKLLDLDDPRALPMRKMDKFRIEAKVDPPAYVYLVWVDPGKDVTLVYPWNPTKDKGTRPEREEPIGSVSVPAASGRTYRAKDAKPGVATIVLLARATPLDVTDDVVRGWFEALPTLPLPPGGERGAVWFDDYVAVAGDAQRTRTFEEVEANDAFARWQGMLQQAVGEKAAFQTAVSFARVGEK